MSATFKNAKKKLSQVELRKIMNAHKGKAQKDVKKIESPLARYNESGQLTCVLCKSIVRSENVWTVHINAKQHRENVELAKRLKEKTNNFTTPLKRPLTPPIPDEPAKKPRGILKNAPKAPETNAKIESTATGSKSELPNDFFDGKNAKSKEENNNKDKDGTNSKVKEVKSKKGTKSTVDNKPAEDTEMEVDETIPEGFFDDPKLDAKARNIEYKDPIEEEWNKFQKEIKDADFHSAAIISEDQEEATNERQLDEIDEQMKNWSRVLTLEKKKVEVITHSDEPMKVELDESSSENEEFDEYLDWRSKKSYR